jgi:manganese/zinc/iron transport system permease protein
VQNPYFDQNFFSFIALFFSRLFHIFTIQWAPDEIQVLVLSLIGISSALVGSFLVLRKMTMLANSLSHTILLGIVLAFLFGSSVADLQKGQIHTFLLLSAAFIVGLLTAILTEFLTRHVKLQEDASTGLVFTTLFAIGIILVNVLTRNAHIGAEVVMGNVDALQVGDLGLAFWIVVINALFIFVFYKEWQLTTFDPPFAKALGFSPDHFNYLLMTLVSITVVGAFRAVGVLMVLTFVTAPPLTARLFCNRLSSMLIISVLIAVSTSFLGVALTRHLLSSYGLALSTGGVVVVLLGLVYLLGACFKLLPRKVVN